MHKNDNGKDNKNRNKQNKTIQTIITNNRKKAHGHIWQ